MRRLIETSDGGWDACLGEKIAVYCGVYIYTGVLSGVNNDYIELTDPFIVYETGELTSGPWKDAQQLLSPHRVMKMSIESWGRAKC